MDPSAVVESFNVIKDTLPCLSSAKIAVVKDKLSFQDAEEAFRRGIVPTVAGAAHAADHAVCEQQLLKVLTDNCEPRSE